MVDRAAALIDQEMNANKDNQYVQFVGDYLKGYIKSNPRHAEKFLQEGKTISGSLKHMEGEARKVKEGNMAMFSPNEGFKIVLDYYGINEEAQVQPVTTKKKVNISLDDLL